MAKVELKCRIDLEEGVSKIESGKFNTPIRNMNYQDPLEIGDIITIPTNYEVLGKIIDSSCEDAKPIPFIYVDVENNMTSGIRRIKFFPNQLAKIVFPVNDSGRRLPKVKTRGTAAAYYATFNNVDDAMESLKGRKILVSDKITYKIERYGDHEIVSDFIYKYDFADNQSTYEEDDLTFKYEEFNPNDISDNLAKRDPSDSGVSNVLYHYNIKFSGAINATFKLSINHISYSCDDGFDRWTDDSKKYLKVKDDGYLYIKGCKITNNPKSVNMIIGDLCNGRVRYDIREGYVDIQYSIDENGYIIRTHIGFDSSKIEHYLNKFFGAIGVC